MSYRNAYAPKKSYFKPKTPVSDVVVISFNKSISMAMGEAINERKPLPPMSAQNIRILDVFKNTERNGMIVARAGTGKSTQLRMLIQASGLQAESKTGHSVGFGILRETYGKLTLLKEMAYEKTFLCLPPTKNKRNPDGMEFSTQCTIGAIVSKCKGLMIDPNDEAAIWNLCATYNIDIEPEEEADVLHWVPIVMEKSLQMIKDQHWIDYDDMVYGPVALNLKCSNKYRYVLGDECLPGWTPVLLADGSSTTIQNIVDNKLPVDVLAYDTSTGKQRPCRVNGWSRTLNNRPLLKIKVQWNLKRTTNVPTNFVIVTDNHRVWADNEWRYAADIRPGMIMQVETSAKKSQVGKITSAGRRVVAETMRQKNASPTESMRTSRSNGSLSVRGGNGTGPTVAEMTLLEKLGNGWQNNYSVKTGLSQSGYPTHYKIDIANPGLGIAIEVDGYSHQSKERKSQDKRKEDFLREQGWTVIRFSNREAIQQTDVCLQTIANLIKDCPILATVVSVENVDMRDNYVYDISVEDCHDFYANGILVHNCQDLNEAQRRLLTMVADRLWFVGDDCQAINGFAGALPDAMDQIAKHLRNTARGLETMPLTMCYRVPLVGIAMARKSVPDIECPDDAIEGIYCVGNGRWVSDWKQRGGESDDKYAVKFVAYTEEEQKVHDALTVELGDLVLCRTNAPLYKAWLRYLKEGKAAFIRGRENEPKILKKFISRFGGPLVEDMLEGLAEHVNTEMRKYARLQNANKAIESLQDKSDCIVALSDGLNTVEQVFDRIDQMFDNAKDRSQVITLSSIHRAKGDESDVVRLIEPELLNIFGKQDWEKKQELNVEYVGGTRFKKAFHIHN